MKELRWMPGFLLVLSLGMTVTAGVFYFREKQLRAAAEELRTEGRAQQVVETRDSHSAEIANLKQQIAELQNELESAKAGSGVPATAAAGQPVNSAAVEGEEKINGAKSAMKSMTEMMSDPAMKDVMRQQQRVALKGMYSDLFAELGLTQEDEDVMMELLLDKQMVNMSLGMQMMTGSLSDEEKKALAQKMVESVAGIDSEIEAFLGKETFESYELFVDSQQERMQLNAFKESLRGTDEPLSFEAEEQLMNAMYETRKNFKFSTNFGTESNPNPDAWIGFDENSADRMILEMRRLNEEIVGKAGGILSPGQLEAFRSAQENQVKMQEMGIKMGLQMQE
jgi:hypothetical protein